MRRERAINLIPALKRRAKFMPTLPVEDTPPLVCCGSSDKLSLSDIKELFMIKTCGLTHIHLVKNNQRSLDFYKTVFGMEVKFWAGDSLVS